ncbi:MAG TPA: tetratricopeptide repeat protein [Ktedonobacterales bacterium]
MRQFMERAVGDRQARLITLGALALLAIILLALPTSTAQETANNRLAGYVVTGLFVIVLIFSLVVEAQQWPFTRADLFAASQARAALRTGRAMPIPPLPRNLSRRQRQGQPDVENFARQLILVPWGQQVQITGADIRPAFDQATLVTRQYTGDWRKLREPIAVFAALPAPWCFVGAASVMARLSFLVGGAYAPIGVRQGLRFIAQAQAVDPENVDALLERAGLLADVYNPQWLKLAEQTLTRIQQIAPNHPRLPFAEAALFKRYGQREKALAALDQAIARAPSQPEWILARANYADTLLQMARWDEAEPRYRELLETERENPWLWHNYSIVLANLKRYDEALAANQRALSIMPFQVAFNYGESIRKRMAAAQAQGGQYR